MRAVRAIASGLANALPWPLILALALIPTAYRLNIDALISFGAPPWNRDIFKGYVLLVLAATSWVAVPTSLWVQVRCSKETIEARAMMLAAGLALALWATMTWQSARFLAWTLPRMVYETELAIKQGGRPWIELSADGTDVVVRAEYVWGISDRVKAFVRAHPGVRSLTVSGPGGITYEGVEIARFVMARGLETRVVDDCFSACADVFLAGRRRTLRLGGTDGLLGLHSSHIPLDGGMQKTWNVDAVDILRRAGATDSFIWRVWETPPEALWKPTPEELARGGIPVEVLGGGAMQAPHAR